MVQVLWNQGCAKHQVCMSRVASPHLLDGHQAASVIVETAVDAAKGALADELPARPALGRLVHLRAGSAAITVPIMLRFH